VDDQRVMYAVCVLCAGCEWTERYVAVQCVRVRWWRVKDRSCVFTKLGYLKLNH